MCHRSRNEAKLDLRLAELRVCACQPDRAGKRRFASAAERPAVDGGDDGLAEMLDEIEKRLARPRLALGIDRRRLRKLADVGSGNECPITRAGDGSGYTLSM